MRTTAERRPLRLLLPALLFLLASTRVSAQVFGSRDQKQVRFLINPTKQIFGSPIAMILSTADTFCLPSTLLQGKIKMLHQTTGVTGDFNGLRHAAKVAADHIPDTGATSESAEGNGEDEEGEGEVVVEQENEERSRVEEVVEVREEGSRGDGQTSSSAIVVWAGAIVAMCVFSVRENRRREASEQIQGKKRALPVQAVWEELYEDTTSQGILKGGSGGRLAPSQRILQ